MFRTLKRMFLPNPLDSLLKKTKRQGGKRILLGWNRGLGDIALGLFAIVQRIREKIPDAEITFLIRENLKEGFTLLEGINVLVAPDWQRGKEVNFEETLQKIGKDPKEFDLIIEKPSPTDWVSWQRGVVVPRLKWSIEHERLFEKFELSSGFTYIGVQVEAETSYGLWRNWPLEKWMEFFDQIERFSKVKVLLFGYGKEPLFSHKNVIDLRGKTNLFELLSIIKNRCNFLILPDSGILSMTYYLDASFPIEVLSLWADPNHGILKQNVFSPNPRLKHVPIIGEKRNLSSVSVERILNQIFPLKALKQCKHEKEVAKGSLNGVGAILLAGGQGSRLKVSKAKGAFPILGKSLFEWILKKTPQKGFPIAIMTSFLNHKETVEFFEKNNYFGREVYFFQQEELPLLDRKKHPLPFLAPSGNGSVFKSFKAAGLDQIFLQKGIDLVTVCPIENPLADPADLKLVGFHRERGAEVTIKCVLREKRDEKMGVLVERAEKCEILEYLDLDQSQNYFYNNTGMMSMSLPFFLKMGEIDLPIHLVEKRIPEKTEPVLKKESFIFDCLRYAKKVEAISFLRNTCYAPVKSLENLSHVEQVLRKIQN